ncbi:MAG: septum formation inhibitor MinC [Acetobacteraceae bacterium]|nr:septum formation inhibitor MinC [Acetobacteraceae bacterium]
MTETRPFIRIRGRSIMALVLTPEPPFQGWLAALDAQIERAPNFFDGRPVVVDLGALPQDTRDAVPLLHEISGRGIHIIGTEAAHPSWEGLEAWGRPLPGAGKPGRPIEISEPPPRAAVQAAAPVPAAPRPEQTSLLINHSVRSGQSIAHEHGDVTILGSVASGAEVVAGSSIHVYGALRGRAIAGLSGTPGSRIFCRRLHAELVAIDGVYQTADDMPPERIGTASCAWLDGDVMRITALD